jgi:putative transposase
MHFMLWLTVRLLTRLLVLPNADDGTKDLEILVLRQQLRVLRRKTGRPRFTAGDRVLLAAASRVLPRTAVGIVARHTPDAAALAPHPGPTEVDLQQGAHAGQAADRPADRGAHRADGQGRTPDGLRADLWGAAQARHPGGRHDDQDAAATPRSRPAPRRSGPTWTQFLRAQAEGSWRATCFTVETIRLKTLFVLLFIHLSSRRVVLAGVTANPDSAWVTQQARNVAMDLDDQGLAVRIVLRDHDAKFTRCFDEVFCSEGAEVIRTPIQAPKANAYAERWVQTVRAGCLDWTLVGGRRHLLRLLRAYVRHYDQQRPHRGLALAVPEARERGSPHVNPGEVRRRDVLGGLIHEYHQVAA